MRSMLRVQVGVLAAVAAFGFAVGASAQEPSSSPHHDVLKKDLGQWDAEMLMWMEGPKSEPLKTTGSESNEMIGGLWVVSRFQAEIFGQEFTGQGQFGYDPTKKKYVFTWVDSMTPVLGTMSGDYDAETKTMTMTGKMYDPQQAAYIESKNVTQYAGPDKRVMKMYAKMQGEWVQTMEIRYKRKK